MQIMKSLFSRAVLGSLSLSIWALASAAGAEPEVAGLERLELVGKVPGTLHTYFAAPASKELLAQRKQLAEQLGKGAGVGFDGSARGIGESGVRLVSSADPSAAFELDTHTGGFSFNGGLRKYRLEERTPGLPDPETALALARRHLDALGLKLDPKQVGGLRAGGLNMAVPDGRGGSVIYEKLRSVRIARQIDGLPVEGDGRVIVQLGAGGALAGLVHQWPALEKAVPVELGDTREIRKGALAEILKVSQRAVRAQLSTVELVLYDDGRGVIEPAYHFVVERDFDHDDGELTRIPYDFYLSTAAKPLAHYPHDERAPIAPEEGKDPGPTAGQGDD